MEEWAIAVKNHTNVQKIALRLSLRELGFSEMEKFKFYWELKQ